MRKLICGAKNLLIFLQPKNEIRIILKTVKKVEKHEIYKEQPYAAHESFKVKKFSPFACFQFCITALVFIITCPFMELSLKFQLSRTAVTISNLFSWNPTFYIFVEFWIAAHVTYGYVAIDTDIFRVPKANTTIL